MHRSVAHLVLAAGCAVPALGGDDPFDFDLTKQAMAPGTAWRVGGFVELGGRYFTVSDDWLSQRLFAQTEVKWSRGRWQAFVLGTAEMDPPTGRYRDPYRSELREIYLRYGGDGFDLTVGKHRVAWGTADGIGTVDRVNAVDFRDPILNARTPSRRPSWLVRAQRSTTLGIFEAVWLPRGRDRKFPEPGSPWATPLLRPAGDHAAVVVIDDPRGHEGGVRYLRYGRGLDWGAAVFDGYSDAPVASRLDGTVLRLLPKRSRTWQANAALGLARSTWRGEVAYTETPTEAGRPGSWQTVVGWDRTFLVDLYVNLQVFYERPDDADASRGGTFAVTKPVLDDVATLALRGQWAERGQHAVEASFEIHANDAFTVSVRALAFAGNPGSPLGHFADHGFVELAARWLY